MYDQARVATPVDFQVADQHFLPFISSRYRSALVKLDHAYRAKRPAAILVSNGRWAPDRVVDNFSGAIDEDASVVRVDQSCADATSFMQTVIKSIGFDPAGMGLADLEKVLRMFLQHQQTKRRRTIIAIQYSDNHDCWVLDTIRRLVETEAEMKLGLMIILAGPPDVISVLNDPIMDVINDQAGERIVLTPFNLCETRDFVRERVATVSAHNGSSTDVGQVFDFDAVTLIHEICAGVPDDVDRLCAKCLEIRVGAEGELVTIEVVKNAARLTQLTSELPDTAVDLPTIDTDPAPEVRGKLLVDTIGEELQEVELADGSILIGRDPLCGVCVASLGISRFHAMLLPADEKLHFIDLNSTNGSHVNGEKAERRSLYNGDVITIGSSRITFVATEENKSMTEQNFNDFSELPSLDKSLNTPITRLSRDLHLIKTS